MINDISWNGRVEMEINPNPTPERVINGRKIKEETETNLHFLNQ